LRSILGALQINNNNKKGNFILLPWGEELPLPRRSQERRGDGYGQRTRWILTHCLFVISFYQLVFFWESNF